MNYQASIDFSSMLEPLMKLKVELQNRLLMQAATKAGNVFRDAYRATVPRHDPPGTFRSAEGAVQHFHELFDAIEQKNRMFTNGIGAYSVIGIKSAPGSRNSWAPQGYWIEEGTDERHHEDGSSTGKVTAQHILQRVVEANQQAAQDVAIAVIVEGINRASR